jgi:4-hydroxybenzoate polyprenyltransferase
VKQFYWYLKTIKIEHSIFALPFAVISAFIAWDGTFVASKLVLIILAMVFARSAAMGFNRLVDAKIDKKNPRTVNREIPAGRLKESWAIVMIALFSVGFIVVAYFLGSLAKILAFPVLLILFAYSLSKRFTYLSHLVLGFALGLSPLGAWIAVSNSFAWPPIVLGLGVMFWTTGFDIIYSCQDADFDQDENLYSIPARFGKALALKIAFVFHFLMLLVLLFFGYIVGLEWLYYLGLIILGIILWFEHKMVSADDLSKVTMAFFNFNGVVSVVFMLFTILDIIS